MASLYSLIVAIFGIYVPHGDPINADCVIGFSFGDGRNHFGKSNVDLARFAAENLRGLPKIFQWEIDEAYELVVKPKDDARVSVIEHHRSPGKYLDTREVALQAVAVMHREKWRTAVILAHPAHVGRAEAVCRKLGLKTVVPGGLSVIHWDHRSTQWYTRNRVLWTIRNVPGTVFYWLRRG